MVSSEDFERLWNLFGIVLKRNTALPKRRTSKYSLVSQWTKVDKSSEESSEQSSKDVRKHFGTNPKNTEQL
jgi:hypothetical protein